MPQVTPRPPAETKIISYQVIPRFWVDFGYSMTNLEGPQINPDIVAIEYQVGETDENGAFVRIRKHQHYYADWPVEVRQAIRLLQKHIEETAAAAGHMDSASAEPDLPLSR